MRRNINWGTFLARQGTHTTDWIYIKKVNKLHNQNVQLEANMNETRHTFCRPPHTKTLSRCSITWGLKVFGKKKSKMNINYIMLIFHEGLRNVTVIQSEQHKHSGSKKKILLLSPRLAWNC